MVITASIEKMTHFPELLQVPELTGIYLPFDFLAEAEYKKIVGRCHAAGKLVCLALPYVMRRGTGEEILRRRAAILDAGFDGFLVRSLDEAELLREGKFPGTRIFDAGLYTWNREAVSEMRKLGAEVLTLPVECRADELAARGFADSEMIVYGRMPAMVSAQCVNRTLGQCRREKKKTVPHDAGWRRMRDRKGAEFVLASHCDPCMQVIYNSAVLWLLDRIPAGVGRVRFVFTDEAEGEAAAVITRFVRGGALRAFPKTGAFTRRHYLRGVE